jgi:hypothetical protein
LIAPGDWDVGEEIAVAFFGFKVVRIYGEAVLGGQYSASRKAHATAFQPSAADGGQEVAARVVVAIEFAHTVVEQVAQDQRVECLTEFSTVAGHQFVVPPRCGEVCDVFELLGGRVRHLALFRLAGLGVAGSTGPG